MILYPQLCETDTFSINFSVIELFYSCNFRKMHPTGIILWDSHGMSMEPMWMLMSWSQLLNLLTPLQVILVKGWPQTVQPLVTS